MACRDRTLGCPCLLSGVHGVICAFTCVRVWTAELIVVRARVTPRKWRPNGLCSVYFNPLCLDVQTIRKIRTIHEVAETQHERRTDPQWGSWFQPWSSGDQSWISLAETKYKKGSTMKQLDPTMKKLGPSMSSQNQEWEKRSTMKQLDQHEAAGSNMKQLRPTE
jgi:hypothetical protein